MGARFDGGTPWPQRPSPDGSTTYLDAATLGATVPTSEVESPGGHPVVVYGYNNESTEFGFRRYGIDASGITETDVTADLITGFGVDIAYDSGRVYSDHGAIVNPVTLLRQGTVSAAGPSVHPDGSADKVFLLTGEFVDPEEIGVFSTQTYLELGVLPLAGLGWQESGTLIRVADDRLALRNGESVLFVEHSLFAP